MNKQEKMQWWAYLLIADSVLWISVAVFIYMNSLIGQQLTDFINTPFLKHYQHLPWYVWVAVAHATICFLIIMFRGFSHAEK